MDPLSAAASITGSVALLIDLYQMSLKIYNNTYEIYTVNKIGKDGKSAFTREVPRLISVMDACTHCQCRCWTSRNDALHSLVASNPSITQLPTNRTLVTGPLMKAAGLRP